MNFTCLRRGLPRSIGLPCVLHVHQKHTQKACQYRPSGIVIGKVTSGSRLDGPPALIDVTQMVTLAVHVTLVVTMACPMPPMKRAPPGRDHPIPSS